MKALRKVVSLFIAAAMLTSSFAFTASVSAAETTDVAVSSDSTIQSEVKDGVILHAFNWSYNSIKENLPAIAAAGYTTVQTSPVQQAKDYGTSNDVAGQWWKLYQPVSMAIAQKSWLGTKDDLKSLCAEADKYGIKIICDIVSNHMGNEVETDPNSLSEQVKTYQPDFYTNKSSYFHPDAGSAGDGSIKSIVQGHVSACPDLNTGNTNVQNAVISLLKECIDCGVDGFRFDAAKHIETPDDGAYASNYWPNITSAAESYYKEKTGGNLYIYGEILNTCGSGRSYGSYTKYINVTDNRTGDAVLAAVSKGNASTAAKSDYKSGVSASNAVLWAESHDTFEGEAGSAGIANTAGVSDENVIKAWSIVASRKDSTALYFARPGAALMGEAATDTAYKSTAVSEVNKFHNLFVGQSEKLGSSDGVAYVARGTSGIVLANCTGTTKSVSISGTGIADGSYVDTITGNKFTVSGGVLTGSIGSTGVAVVYKGSITPKNTCSVESGTFKGETMTVELGLENAVSGTYCLDDSTPVTYTGKTTIRIGSDYKYGETINLTLTATDGAKTTTATYKYTKQEAASSGVYIFFDTANFSKWTAPFNVYIYDEDTSSTTTYKNASWPGQAMKLDPATGYYYVEVSSNSCIAEDKTTEEGSVSDYDLAHSSNTYVIIGDSNGKQHPADGARTKRKLDGSSKILVSTAKAGWESTTLVPSAETPVEATDVTKGTVTTVPTTAPAPTTTVPVPTTTASPVGTMIYGDVNGDGVVKVNDATAIQKHSVGLELIPDKYLVLADLNADGKINVLDATMIQKYLVGGQDAGITGQPYVTETEPVSTVATEPVTTPTEPTTTAPPADTYTFYFKTTLGWMTDDGVSLFAYDKSTGESYFLEKDENAYPNVYTAEVPSTMTSCVVYRYLEAVYETPVGGDTGNVYNCWSAKVSKTNNCVTLSNDEQVSVGPYVAEEKPAFELSRVYFDNSKAKWSEVYIYGWAESGLGKTAVAMTKIEGTNIWYYDFATPLSPGANCFLFKDTPGGGPSDWYTQTDDVTVTKDMNCYLANAGSKSGGSWYYYTEK
ncbi:MAG: alpha-amylase family glycosyl hydrolase [Ruminococcus sp.]